VRAHRLLFGWLLHCATRLLSWFRLADTGGHATMHKGQAQLIHCCLLTYSSTFSLLPCMHSRFESLLIFYVSYLFPFASVFILLLGLNGCCVSNLGYAVPIEPFVELLHGCSRGVKNHGWMICHSPTNFWWWYIKGIGPSALIVYPCRPGILDWKLYGSIS
jgi:hypothetical protein